MFWTLRVFWAQSWSTDSSSFAFEQTHGSMPEGCGSMLAKHCHCWGRVITLNIEICPDHRTTPIRWYVFSCICFSDCVTWTRIHVAFISHVTTPCSRRAIIEPAHSRRVLLVASVEMHAALQYKFASCWHATDISVENVYPSAFVLQAILATRTKQDHIHGDMHFFKTKTLQNGQEPHRGRK